MNIVPTRSSGISVHSNHAIMKNHCTEHKQARVNSVGDRKTPLLVILFSLLITGCGSSSFAQSSSAKTAVLIIGTVHSGNRHITPKTLGKVLSDFSPDIVLIEQDEDFKPVFGLLAAYWLRIVRPSLDIWRSSDFTERTSTSRFLHMIPCA